VVVDNHSPFHPVVRRLKRLRGVTIRGFNRNHGFAKAVNRGSRLGRGKWILLMNPDVTVEDGFLDDAIAAIDRMEESGPHAGVVGFRLKNADGTNQASAGPFPTFLNTLSGLLPRVPAASAGTRTRRRIAPWTGSPADACSCVAIASRSSAGSMNRSSSTTKTWTSAVERRTPGGASGTIRGWK